MVATFFFRTILGLLFGLVCVTSAVEQIPIYQEFNNFIETTTCKYYVFYMKIAQNRICISDPPEMCEETSTAYYGDILDVFETSRTADCWDACDVVKECAFVNFIISTQNCILLRDVNTTMRTTYKQGSTSRLKGCLSKCCEIQSTLDIVDFSVTQ